MASEGFMHSGIWDNLLLWTNVVTSHFLFHLPIVKSVVLQKCVLHGLEVYLISLFASCSGSLSLIALTI